ncbi:unnamed protein product [Rhizophagus irregularis]|nr:unnamed protein product [Rhizophagus irregularis]
MYGNDFIHSSIHVTPYMHYTSVLNSNGVQGWDLFRSKYESKSIINTERVYDKNDRFGKNRYEHFDGTITNQFANSQNAGYIYILMKWRPKNPFIQKQFILAVRLVIRVYRMRLIFF